MAKKKLPLKVIRSSVKSPLALAHRLSNLKANQRVILAEELLKKDAVEQEIKKRTPTGLTATRMWGDVFNEEYISELKMPQAAIVYDKMLRSDYQVGLLETSIMGVIKAADYTFTTPDVPNGEKHMELCKWQWEHGFNKTADENLNDLGSHIFEGFSVIEPLHIEPYKHPKFGLIWRHHTMGFIDQSSIVGWRMGRGDVLGMHQVTNYSSPHVDTWIPGENLVVLTEKRKGDNVEGRGVLRTAYGPYWRKNVYYKLLGIGLEKSSMGVIIITVPPGKLGSTEESTFIEAVENYVAHENAYLKKTGSSVNDKFEGFNIEVMKIDFDADKVIAAIKLEDTNIAKCGAAAFSELGQGGNGGSYSLGVADIDFFFSMIKSRIRYIAQKTQRIWNDLIIYNFGEQAEYPELKGEFTDKVGEELARILNYYYNIGVYTPQPEDEAFLRQRHNLPALKITAQSDPAEVAAKKAQADAIVQAIAGNKNDEDEEAEGEDTEKVEKPDDKDTDDKAKDDKLTLHSKGGIILSYAQKAVRGINLKAFRKQKEVLTDSYNSELTAALSGIQDKYIHDIANKIKNNPNDPLKAVSEIELGFTRPLKDSISAAIITALFTGKKQGKEIIRSKKSKLSLSADGLPSMEGISPLNKKWVRNTAVITSTTLLDTFKKAGLLAAKTSIDKGESEAQVLFDVRKALDSWKGNKNNLGAGAVIPSALDAGQMEAYREAEFKITGWVYVNDDPVTTICNWLNNRIAQEGDPNVERYTPPNHWGCDSRKLPILSDEPQPEKWDGWDVPASVASAQMLLSYRVSGCPDHFKFWFNKEAV